MVVHSLLLVKVVPSKKPFFDEKGVVLLMRRVSRSDSLKGHRQTLKMVLLITVVHIGTVGDNVNRFFGYRKA